MCGIYNIVPELYLLPPSFLTVFNGIWYNLEIGPYIDVMCMDVGITDGVLTPTYIPTDIEWMGPTYRSFAVDMCPGNVLFGREGEGGTHIRTTLPLNTSPHNSSHKH